MLNRVAVLPPRGEAVALRLHRRLGAMPRTVWAASWKISFVTK